MTWEWSFVPAVPIAAIGVYLIATSCRPRRRSLSERLAPYQCDDAGRIGDDAQAWLADRD
jgi:hypothetical protein